MIVQKTMITIRVPFVPIDEQVDINVEEKGWMVANGRPFSLMLNKNGFFIKKDGLNIMAKNNNLVNIAEFSIRNADGGIDIPATIAKFESVLIEIDSSRIDYSGKVSEALDSFYSKNVGIAVSMKNLPMFVLAEMSDITPRNAPEMSEAVLAYVRRSSDFEVSKGPSGGVRRIADMNEEELNAYELREAKRAEKVSK